MGVVENELLWKTIQLPTRYLPTPYLLLTNSFYFYIFNALLERRWKEILGGKY